MKTKSEMQAEIARLQAEVDAMPDEAQWKIGDRVVINGVVAEFDPRNPDYLHLVNCGEDCGEIWFNPKALEPASDYVKRGEWTPEIEQELWNLIHVDLLKEWGGPEANKTCGKILDFVKSGWVGRPDPVDDNIWADELAKALVEIGQLESRIQELTQTPVVDKQPPTKAEACTVLIQSQIDTGQPNFECTSLDYAGKSWKVLVSHRESKTPDEIAMERLVQIQDLTAEIERLREPVAVDSEPVVVDMTRENFRREYPSCPETSFAPNHIRDATKMVVAPAGVVEQLREAVNNAMRLQWEMGRDYASGSGLNDETRGERDELRNTTIPALLAQVVPLPEPGEFEWWENLMVCCKDGDRALSAKCSTPDAMLQLAASLIKYAGVAK